MAIVVNPQSELIREPNLLVPGKKPIGPVKIDWSHPLAKGLVAAYLWDSRRGYRNIIPHGKPSVAGGNQSFDGDSGILDGSGEYIRVNPFEMGITDTYTGTLVYQRKGSYGGGFPRIFQRGDSDTAQIFRNNSDTSMHFMSAAYTVPNVWDYQRHVVSGGVYMISTDTVNERRLVVDGTEVIHIADDNLDYPVYNVVRWMMIGNRPDGARYNGGGNKAFFLHNRFLSSVEQKEITNDPYQFLEPA